MDTGTGEANERMDQRAEANEAKAERRGRWGVIEAYERYLVGTPSADVDRWASEYFEALFEMQREHYRAPFGYLSNRANLNAGNPAFFVQARRRVPLWRSYALVAYSKLTTSLFPAEQAALGEIPNQVFHALEDAKAWTDRVIEAERRAWRSRGGETSLETETKR